MSHAQYRAVFQDHSDRRKCQVHVSWNVNKFHPNSTWEWLIRPKTAEIMIASSKLSSDQPRSCVLPFIKIRSHGSQLLHLFNVPSTLSQSCLLELLLFLGLLDRILHQDWHDKEEGCSQLLSQTSGFYWSLQHLYYPVWAHIIVWRRHTDKYCLQQHENRIGREKRANIKSASIR